MTNERDRKGTDALVSETYRELADERAPQHLDRAVLQMAAGKDAHSGFNFSLLMKPVAWAATIALSLAIVLEFSELPTEVRQAVPAAEPVPAPLVDLSENEAKPKLDSFAVAAPGTNQSAMKKQSVSQERPSLVDAESPSKEDSADVEEVVVTDSAARITAPAASSNADFAATTESFRERTAGMSQLSEEKAESGAMQECAAEARMTAESWLSCIKDLHALGAFGAAAREFESFSDEYPGDYSAELADFEANK